ncbi:hypothetical protein JNW90_30430 [Micromonospora sp. STR1s_5]|nr:hypothetical protein [Micromonospora sp. STR1s_5]
MRNVLSDDLDVPESFRQTAYDKPHEQLPSPFWDYATPRKPFNRPRSSLLP